MRLSIRKFDGCVHNYDKSKEEFTLCLSILFNDIGRKSYDEMCPILEKEIVIVDSSPWFNAEILRAKLNKKKKEILRRRHKTDEAR